MKIRKLLAFFLRYIYPRKLELIKSELLGKKLSVIKGTLREKVDQDDAWFYFLAKNSRSLFDIGANLGYTTLLALIGDKAKRIVLVDANPEALSKAGKNLFINNLGQSCSFYPAFVGDQLSSTIKFYTVGSGAAGSMYSSHAHTATLLNETIDVPTTTIDHLMDFYGFIPDLIKIDIEGAEAMALKGATRLASNRKTRFLVEMHSPKELPMGKNAAMVLEWCKDSGYSAWYLKEKKIMNNPEMISKRGKCHLLLQPIGWPYPNFLIDIKQGAPLPESV